jgi:hypothetical protein
MLFPFSDRNLEQRFELFVGKYELELVEFQESSQVIYTITPLLAETYVQ